jgi:HEPN domain-containing protein
MIKELTKKWMDRVKYDYETAEAMLASGRYIYAIFMCQQSIEKCLKAFITEQDIEILPIHNLRRLCEVANIINELNDDKLKRLDYLSQYYINARYKEDIEILSKRTTKVISENYLKFTRDFIEWIKIKLK